MGLFQKKNIPINGGFITGGGLTFCTLRYILNVALLKLKKIKK